MIRIISFTVHGGSAQAIEESVAEQLKSFLGETHEVKFRTSYRVRPYVQSAEGRVELWEAEVEIEYVLK